MSFFTYKHYWGYFTLFVGVALRMSPAVPLSRRLSYPLFLNFNVPH